MFFRLSLLLYFLSLAYPGYAQSGWELSKEEKGIKVFTKKGDSSAFRSIKVECVFEGSWEKLFAILMDIKRQEQWVYHTKKSYVVKKVAKNEVIYYVETSLPWPAKNRDAVVRMKLYDDPSNKVNRVVSNNEPGAVPPKGGLVRIPQYKAVWEVKTLEKNKIAITYFLNVNPGGSLPAWIVNLFITTGPYETFRKLGEMLKNQSP